MTATEVLETSHGVAPTRRPRKRASSGLLARCLTPRAELTRAETTAAWILVWLLVLGAWALLSYGGLVKKIFLPAPHAVVVKATEMWADGSLWEHSRSSLTVVFVGFALSSALSVPIGLMAGSYRAVQALIGPVVEFTRYLPVTAFLPLFILWIGIGLEEQAAVIFFGVFFQQIVMVGDLVRNVPNDLLNASYTLGASRRSVVWNVMLPAVAPGILDVLRVTIAWGWTYVVVAEMVGANSGLGYISIKATRGFQVDTIFVAIAVIGLFGIVTDQLFRMTRKYVFPWAA